MFWLASCTSTATSKFYLLSLTETTSSNNTAQSSTPPTSSPLVVRIGYFSLCVLQSADSWLCSSDTASLIQEFGSGESDPAGIFTLALRFKDDILSPSMMYVSLSKSQARIMKIWIVSSLTRSRSFVSLLCVCIAFLTCKRPGFVALKLHPSNEYTTIKSYVLWDETRNILAFLAICLSALSAILAIVWQYLAVMTVVGMMWSKAGTHPSASMGVESMALGWATFGLIVGIAIKMFILIRCMRGRAAAEHDVESTSGNNDNNT